MNLSYYIIKITKIIKTTAAIDAQHKISRFPTKHFQALEAQLLLQDMNYSYEYLS